jgi:hypothetical protein
MRRERFVHLINVELLGAVVAASLLAVSLALPTPWREVLVAVAASFIFGTSLLLLEAFHRRYLDTVSSAFFGREMMDKCTVFVFPEFVLAPEVLDSLTAHHPQRLFAKATKQFANTVHRVDVPRAVAANDMEALVYLAGLFEANHSRRFELRPDSTAVHQCDCSFISVGLSSNDCTHLYLATTDQPLFEIVPDAEDSEFVRLPDGSEFRSDPDRQVGVIVRHTPESADRPERRWFIVAGLGPVGTIGAAWFLSEKWRHLHRTVGDEDFIAVISVPSATERRVKLETVYLGGAAEDVRSLQSSTMG